MKSIPLLALVFLLLSAHAASAGTIVTMQLLSPPGSYEIYTFLVDGVDYQLLCDDALGTLSQLSYQAKEDTLTDLVGSLLDRDSDPNIVQDYETIAILDTWALDNPSDIEEVQLAIWSITQDRAPRDPDAAAILSWAQGQNPADYDLGDFVIFAAADNQEQTGFIPLAQPPPSDAPEPSTWLMVVGGIGLVAWRSSALRRRRP